MLFYDYLGKKLIYKVRTLGRGRGAAKTVLARMGGEREVKL